MHLSVAITHRTKSLLLPWQFGSSITVTRDYFEKASENAARLARIVQELTDFARVQRARGGA